MFCKLQAAINKTNDPCHVASCFSSLHNGLTHCNAVVLCNHFVLENVHWSDCFFIKMNLTCSSQCNLLISLLIKVGKLEIRFKNSK